MVYCYSHHLTLTGLDSKIFLNYFFPVDEMKIKDSDGQVKLPWAFLKLQEGSK